MDQGYSSIATGMYPYMFNSASIYRTIFLFIRVKLLIAPLGTIVATFLVKFSSWLHMRDTVEVDIPFNSGYYHVR